MACILIIAYATNYPTHVQTHSLSSLDGIYKYE
jgi:hypothetical protein